MNNSNTNTPTYANPAPGVIFERYTNGDRVILNPDLTITLQNGDRSATYAPTPEQLMTYAVDAFDTMVGWCEHNGWVLGPVGFRFAENYEAAYLARFGNRSDYGC